MFFRHLLYSFLSSLAIVRAQQAILPITITTAPSEPLATAVVDDETIMSNLPAANVICNLQDYTWSRGDIVNALWQAYDCVERIGGNTCTNSATHYPHGYYN
ncbi:hypothetical protein TWF173_001929 [Orbilia oligospora]|nr:hypothetical protein TWF173_001929 [Orbilia oligospora]